MKNFNFLLVLLVVFISIVCAQESGGDREGVQQQQENGNQQQGERDDSKDKKDDKKDKKDDNKDDKKDDSKDKKDDNKDDKKDDSKDKKDDNKDKKEDDKDNKGKEKPDMSKNNYSRSPIQFNLISPERLENLERLVSMDDKIDFQWDWGKNIVPKTATELKFTLERIDTPGKTTFEIKKAGVMEKSFIYTLKDYNKQEDLKETLGAGVYKLWIHDAEKVYDYQVNPIKGEFSFSTKLVIYEQNLTPDTKYVLDSSTSRSVTSINWGLGSLTTISLLATIHYLLI